jgi:hypothetical protein
MPSYHQPGYEWVAPQRKDFRFMCCQCGLVHSLDFRIRRFKKGGKNREIQMRVFLAPRSTALARRKPHKSMPVKSA